MSPSIEVLIDDRLRLAGALLAAGTWPEQEQMVQPYKPHHVAEEARQYFTPYASHPAVASAQAVTLSDGGPAALYQYAFAAEWPAEMAAQAADFVAVAQPEVCWEKTRAEWEANAAAARGLFAEAELGLFLDDLFGPNTPQLIFMPNLLFPALRTVTVGVAGEKCVCVPPPKALGISPPWPYNQRAEEILAVTAEALARALFEANLSLVWSALAEHSERFGAAVAALFLRERLGPAAGEQLCLMNTKTRGLTGLHELVNALELCLADRRAKRYTTLADYLPMLAEHLERP